MEDVSRDRAFSSPELLPFPTGSSERSEDYSLEGIATNVKLLLKLIQDQNDATITKKDSDDRTTQRIAGMMTILDDVKSRIQKSQSAKIKKVPQLRRCNTDLRPSEGGAPVAAAADQKAQEPASDEKERLRKQLTASLAARKSLEVICSSLGKEKEIMATELARKVHELNEAEELVNDLKAQNETLMTKLQACFADKKSTPGSSKSGGGGAQAGNSALQERNRALSAQLLKSLDTYRSLKRKYRAAKEENRGICTSMDVIGKDVAAGLEIVRSFRNRLAPATANDIEFEYEISTLEQMFERFHVNISKHKTGGAKPEAEITTTKPPVA